MYVYVRMCSIHEYLELNKNRVVTLIAILKLWPLHIWPKSERPKQIDSIYV